jgi:hypothetical protein
MQQALHMWKGRRGCKLCLCWWFKELLSVSSQIVGHVIDDDGNNFVQCHLHDNRVDTWLKLFSRIKYLQLLVFHKVWFAKKTSNIIPRFYKHNNNMNNGAFERGWHDECKFCEQRNKFWHKCMSIIKTCRNISEWYWYNLKHGESIKW